MSLSHRKAFSGTGFSYTQYSDVSSIGLAFRITNFLSSDQTQVDSQMPNYRQHYVTTVMLFNVKLRDISACRVLMNVRASGFLPIHVR
ncbi:uncharacterized protein ARMOST_18594 [Armillaria ostoyae]|uniref:Uncharacterized protein n=1 Tax=Armillaria ostoyae TaxID=47428 RepID=A0A284S251_ARMOS|nr:uncharacterized protein ARMOST_18594 [Armillaria ostoyae]